MKITVDMQFDDNGNPVIHLNAKSKKQAETLGKLGAWIKKVGVQQTANYHVKTQFSVFGYPAENFGNGESLDKLIIVKLAYGLDMMET